MIKRKIIGKDDNNLSTEAAELSDRNKPKAWHVFVGRLDCETPVEVLTDHLTSSGVAVIDCKNA